MTFDLAHALAVAYAAGDYGDQLWLAGLLHDAIEDCAATVDELREVGVPASVIYAADVLARTNLETYADYIERLCAIPGVFGERVRAVKLADLRVNLRRMDDAHASLERRYEAALRALEDFDLQGLKS